MKPPKLSLSVLALIVANIAPLVAVLFFEWDVMAVVVVYWVENIVIGFYNVLKMAIVPAGPTSPHALKLFLMPFFCVHYGMFCLVHGVFVFAFFGASDGLGSPGKLFDWQLLPAGFAWAVFALFISHGVSFVHNFLIKKEHESLTLQKLMAQPYGRIVLLHVAIIADGFPIMALGSPIPLLCILVLLKVIVDIYLHQREHRIDPDQPDTSSLPVNTD